MVEELGTTLLGRVQQTTLSGGTNRVTDYLGIRAQVTFRQRQAAVIQVVLKRQRDLPPNPNLTARQKIWFYTVYELRRGGRSKEVR